MPKFRKKLVVIEAMLFDGGNGLAIERWASGFVDSMEYPIGTFYVQVSTREGIMRADEGDWIIKGVAGEFDPCKPNIFTATYEPVDDD